jgi:hypothetical protein
MGFMGFMASAVLSLGFTLIMAVGSALQVLAVGLISGDPCGVLGMGTLRPVKLARVSANNDWPLLYLPREVVERLGLRRGVKVMLEMDEEAKVLVVRRVD